jgi:hypothetical protein
MLFGVGVGIGIGIKKKSLARGDAEERRGIVFDGKKCELRIQTILREKGNIGENENGFFVSYY